MDSVFLLHQLLSKGFRQLHLIYFDHGLRSESEIRHDRDIVKFYAEQFTLSYSIRRVPVKAFSQRYKCSVEMAGRSLRYAMLAHYGRCFGYSCIVTAHHATDDMESCLYHLVNGGIHGVMSSSTHLELGDGIQVYRPLLHISKSVIQRHVSSEQLAFHADSSNEDGRFTRNVIRQQLSPILENLNSEYEAHILKVSSYFSDLHKERFLSVTHIFSELPLSSFPLEFDIHVLDGLSDTELMEFCRLLLNHANVLLNRFHRSRLMSLHFFSRYTTGNLHDLSQFLRPHFDKRLADSRLDISGIRVYRRGTQVALMPHDGAMFMPVFPMPLTMAEGELNIPFLGVCVRYYISTHFDMADLDQWDAVIDISRCGNLRWDIRHIGDRFHPLGMPEEYKLKRYLIAQKIPVWRRDYLPLLRDDNDIYLVLGAHISEKVRLNSESTRVLQMRYVKLK